MPEPAQQNRPITLAIQRLEQENPKFVAKMDYTTKPPSLEKKTC